MMSTPSNENALLLLKIKELEEHHGAFRDSVICAFNQLLDLKDIGTGVHSTRLAEWALRQGLRREEILAIGDNHNDLEMLHFAGIPVVMGNCVPELKTYGWHETHSNDEGGVAAAIEKFALREAESCA